MSLKYSLLMTGLLTLSCSAEMCFDSRAAQFFTYPESATINKEAYHRYACAFFEDFCTMWSSGKHTQPYCLKTAKLMNLRKASKDNSEAAKQFMKDLEAIIQPLDAMEMLYALQNAINQ